MLHRRNFLLVFDDILKGPVFDKLPLDFSKLANVGGQLGIEIREKQRFQFQIHILAQHKGLQQENLHLANMVVANEYGDLAHQFVGTGLVLLRRSDLEIAYEAACDALPVADEHFA
ncbi:hypothetical protein D3C77_542290 [compost metagenome]